MHITVLLVFEQISDRWENGMFVENDVNMSSVKKRLMKYEEAGVKLYLDGNPSDTDHILDKCVREDTAYMADYVTDEQGQVREIRYDAVPDTNLLYY